MQSCRDRQRVSWIDDQLRRGRLTVLSSSRSVSHYIGGQEASSEARSLRRHRMPPVSYAPASFYGGPERGTDQAVMSQAFPIAARWPGLAVHDDHHNLAVRSWPPLVSRRVYPFCWLPTVLTPYSTVEKRRGAFGMSHHLKCPQTCPGTSGQRSVLHMCSRNPSQKPMHNVPALDWLSACMAL
jgi:hypothetical protein